MSWNGGQTMASSVPIPSVSSSQSLHSITDLMSVNNLQQTKLSSSAQRGISSSKDSGLSSTQQSSISPIYFQTQGNSPAYMTSSHVNSSESNVCFSPLDNNSPSPQMWVTQNMDMDDNNCMDVKIEPFDIIHPPEEDDLLNFLNSSFTSPKDLTATAIEDFIYDAGDTNCSGGSVDPIGLDPQHSSPAAMNLVNPGDILGFAGGNANHSAQTSTSFQGFSNQLFGNNDVHNLTDFQNSHMTQPPQQHSHSLTSINFVPQQLQMQHQSINTNSNNNCNLNQPPQTIPSNKLRHDSENIKLETSTPEPIMQDPSHNEPMIFLKDNSTTIMGFPHLSSSTTECLPQQLQVHLQPSQHLNTFNCNQVMPHPSFLPQTKNLNMHVSEIPSASSVTTNVHSNMINTQMLNTGGGIINTGDFRASLGNNYQQQPLVSKTQSGGVNKMIQKRQQYFQRHNNTHPVQMKSNLSAAVPSTPSNTPVASSFMTNHPSASISTLRDMLQSPSMSFSNNLSSSNNQSPLSSCATSPLPPNLPNSPISNFAISNPVPPDDIFHNSYQQNNSSNNPRQSPVNQRGMIYNHPMRSGGRVVHNPRYPTASQMAHLQNRGFSVGSNLSTSAPLDKNNILTEQMMWRRREPRIHMPSTGSVAEEEILGLVSKHTGVTSPFGIEESIADSEDESGSQAYVNFDSEDEIESLQISDVPKRRTTSSSSSTNTSAKKERYFWQYNVQAKGPKGQRVSVELSNDPHQLVTISDPVFTSDCVLQGIKHSGKARRGDGNDLDPNPAKLVSIGRQLKDLNKTISDMMPMSEQPSHSRGKGRKEKNKLASRYTVKMSEKERLEKNKNVSRACRLKKKAQHEANKIRLFGVNKEHEMLLHKVNIMKMLLMKKYKLSTGQSYTGCSVKQELQDCTNDIKSIAENIPFEITSHVTDFINNVIEKSRVGVGNGGLDDMSTVMVRDETALGAGRESPLDFQLEDDDDDEELQDYDMD